MGKRDFLFGRTLGPDFSECLFPGYPIPLAETFYLDFEPAVGQNDAVIKLMEASLDDQGGLGNVNIVFALFFQLPYRLSDFFHNCRMSEAIQIIPFDRVLEYYPAQFLPVYFIIVPQDTPTEMLDQGLPDFFTGGHQFVGDKVGLLKITAFFFQNSGHYRLTGGNASGQSHKQHFSPYAVGYSSTWKR